MRARLGIWLFGFSFAFLTFLPAFADDKPMTVHATPAMWHVKGPRGEAWLLGSFHALPDDVEWQTAEIKHAIKTANVFVFEIAMDEAGLRDWSETAADNMLLPLSTALPARFDEQMRSEWRTAVDHTDISPEALVHLRPWFAARAFEGAMSPGNVHVYSDEGVDIKIAHMAQARGAAIRGLETSEVHLHALKRDATSANEIAQLRDAMHRAAGMKMRPFAKLLADWEHGDVKAIAAQSAEQSPVEHKALLDDRNQAWVPKIEKMLTEKHTFLITVGAAHLAGPSSVVDLLRKAGYTVDGPDVLTKTASR